MKVQKIDIDKLKPHPKNPRIHPDSAIEKLERSIKEFGWTNPILVSKDGYILAGHARLKAAKKAGLEEVPVIYLPLEGAKAEAYLIADNRLQDETDWDYEKLEDLLQELDTGEFDLELTGFDMDEIDSMLFDINDMDDDNFDIVEAIEEIEEPITVRGDIWLLGRHRLMCGDSTSKEDINILMDGKKTSLIITDPPYNVDYTGATKDALKIKNDNMDNETFYNFLYGAFVRMYEAAEDGASIYVFHADTEGLNFRKAFIDAGFYLAQCCIWAKQSMVMGRQDYHWQHEPVLYGWKPTSSHYWNGDRKQTTLWHFDRPFRNELHPTMKPVPLMAYPIRNSSTANSIVLDPFIGSGSTLMACEETGRICYSMELDEKYCDVVVKRYIETAGEDKVFLHRDGEKIPYNDIT